ncbi:CRISPR-associated protein Cas4 [Archaeoglobales archaeon]|nr:MAG: CRISPR-associated protein Cas4 [Archaeoglobales archaeon]
MIDVSDLIQYLYCPRKIYFIKVMGIKLKKPKMEFGKELHGKLRIKFDGDILYNLYLESENYEIKGVVDAVIKQKNNYYPVDAKFTRFNKLFYGWKMQLVAYAVLIEENFGVTVKKGYIYFIDEKRLKEVEIVSEDKKALRDIVKKVERIINEEKIPNVEKSKKCEYCEMKKLC